MLGGSYNDEVFEDEDYTENAYANFCSIMSKPEEARTVGEAYLLEKLRAKFPHFDRLYEVK